MTNTFTTEQDTLLRRLSDRAEISELLTRNWRALDAQEFDDADEMYTDDITLVVGGGEPIAGRAEVVRITRELNVHYQATQHNGSSLGIELDGDRATVTANVIGVLIGRENEAPPVSVNVTGAHVGCVRTERGWRMNSIELTPRYRYPVG
ncbi:hypothetical protein ALI144C_20095 [Actinosynnema sp. ALI-1.44]|uniref:nuclear transport factor 2 family protein n=1 Tax=Actinosynnema sp. ALI-1.44 TaxID=1933779 RepID=UPI00097C07E6|nr:nuclear transport factor 2 family protein [Actinosynnema sp. ALI-1.44]ONI81603.1 hypothetical protein ALI144C_20095 [Actinosynnema sp. ALI-1.44]